MPVRPPSAAIHSVTSPSVYTANVGGVLYNDFSLICVRYCSSVGRFLSARSARSLRTITTVTPLGPRFFCAPAKINPNLETSTGREQISEDISATNGASACGSEDDGSAWYCVPSMVL